MVGGIKATHPLHTSTTPEHQHVETYVPLRERAGDFRSRPRHDPASRAVTQTASTISGARAPRLRSFTGSASPCSTGPIA